MGLREMLFGRKKRAAQEAALAEEERLAEEQEKAAEDEERFQEKETSSSNEESFEQENGIEAGVSSEGILEQESKIEEESCSEGICEDFSTLKSFDTSDKSFVYEETGINGSESSEESENDNTPTWDQSENNIIIEEDAKQAKTPDEKKKKGFFARLKEGLAKTRNNIVRGIDSLFNGFSAIDDDFYEELEEILIMGDIGVNATMEIVARLKSQVKEQHIKEPKECKQLLIEGIKEQMRVDETAYDFEKQQSVIMVIGVNGVGKTTSVGKLAGKLKDEGRRVLIAAADTFRAAAGDQLAEWARRADVPMVGGNEGADPASVVYDAVHAAKARDVDVLLVDTAGRLHNKKNLMEELRKMNRIIDKEFPNAHRENLIVLDGTTGQNALVQAREFGTVAELTGIILTKMDGTAKGGIAVAIQSELRVPVKYIGVGETIDDLQKFDSDEFVNALFDVPIEDGENED